MSMESVLVPEKEEVLRTKNKTYWWECQRGKKPSERAHSHQVVQIWSKIKWSSTGWQHKL